MTYDYKKEQERFEEIHEDLNKIRDLRLFFNKIIEKIDSISRCYFHEEYTLEDTKKKIELLFIKIDLEYKYWKKGFLNE